VNRKLVTIITILSLWLLNYLSQDPLSAKLSGFLSSEINFFKYFIIPIVAYFIANYFSKQSDKYFLILFFTLNAFSIYSFLDNAINNRISSKNVRQTLNTKIVQLEYAGWGYEADSLNYNEYVELNDGYYPNVPKSAENIFQHNWYEIDARHMLEFSVPKNFDLIKFYKNDTTILNEFREVEFGEFLERHKISNNRVQQGSGKQRFDTTKLKRYKWERSFN